MTDCHAPSLSSILGMHTIHNKCFNILLAAVQRVCVEHCPVSHLIIIVLHHPER